MRLRVRFSWEIQRQPDEPNTVPPASTSEPTAPPTGAERERPAHTAEGAAPPPGLDFVYQTAVDALTDQDRTLSSLDAKAGILIGATAAAFGLIASNGGSSSSLFAIHPALSFLGILALAMALGCLLAVVLVRDYIEFPGIPTFVSLANLPESRIKELSLDGLQKAWRRNKRQIDLKARFLLAGQLVIGIFVLLVVCFKLSEWTGWGPVTIWVQRLLSTRRLP